MIFSYLPPDIPQSSGLFTIWLKFPGNSAEIQSWFVNLGKGFCWLLRAPPAGRTHGLPDLEDPGGRLYSVFVLASLPDPRVMSPFLSSRFTIPDADHHIPGGK